MGSPFRWPGARRRLAVAAAAVVLLLIAGGCAEEPAPDGPTVAIIVISEESGLAVPDVKFVLLDADTNLPLAGPAVSDATGYCRLDAVGCSRSRLVVFGGPLWSVHHQPDWYGQLLTTGGRPVDGGGLVVASSAPDVNNLVTMRPRALPGTLPRFSGRVVDAGTGRALDQAFISLSPWPTGYGGDVVASDDVTGPDGLFEVYDIPIAMNLDTGIGFQVLPLIVSRRDYRPVSWKYDPPGGLDYTDVAGLVIALTPLGPQDTGRLSGRVVRDGLPLADLLVGLGAASALKGAVGVSGQVARTDAEGRFGFEHLAPGVYVVHPGFLVGDGAWFAGPEVVPVTVGTGGIADAGVLAVLHEIEPALGNRSRLAATDTMATFRWGAVPGAAGYDFFLDGVRAADAVAESVTVVFPGLDAGLHYWRVVAQDGDDVVVGAMQNDSWFRQDPP